MIIFRKYFSEEEKTSVIETLINPLDKAIDSIEENTPIAKDRVKKKTAKIKEITSSLKKILSSKDKNSNK